MNMKYRIALLGFIMVLLTNNTIIAQSLQVVKRCGTDYTGTDTLPDPFPGAYYGTFVSEDYVGTREMITDQGRTLFTTSGGISGTMPMLSPDGRYMFWRPHESINHLTVWNLETQEAATLQLLDSIADYLSEGRPSDAYLKRVMWNSNNTLMIRYYPPRAPEPEAELEIVISENPLQLIPVTSQQALADVITEFPESGRNYLSTSPTKRYTVQMEPITFNNEYGLDLRIIDETTGNMVYGDLSDEDAWIVGSPVWLENEDILFYLESTYTPRRRARIVQVDASNGFTRINSLNLALQNEFGSSEIVDRGLGITPSHNQQSLGFHVIDPVTDEGYVVKFTPGTGEIVTVCSGGIERADGFVAFGPYEDYIVYAYIGSFVAIYEFARGNRYSIDSIDYIGWVAPESQPGTCNVTISANNPTNLITIIADANATPEPDTICLADGTYTLTASNVIDYGDNGLPFITSDLTLVGLGDNVVIERGAGAPAFRLLHVKDTGTLTLENLTLSNGNAGITHGGAVYARGALTLRDVTITGNFARRGGGVRMNGAPLTVTGSSFQNNSADREGGAIYVSGINSPVDVSSSQFTANSATNSGGGFYLSGTTTSLIANDVVFTGNQANGGGAIYEVPSTLNLTNATFTSNEALVSSGGAIYTSTDSSVAVANSTFTTNEAASDGGALRSGGNLTLTDSTLTSNVAQVGAAVFSQNAATITGNRIELNAASELGGGLYVSHNGNTHSITGNCISGNTAPQFSGLLGVTSNTNATDNWWGATDGPVSGNTVSANVIFTPFLSACPLD